MRRESRHRFLLAPVPATLLALVASATLATAPVVATTTYNYRAYLGGPAHTSYTTDAQITTANAATLVKAWTWTPTPGTLAGQPSGGLYASPTVYSHRIYIGAKTGDFYALSESTGAVIWKRFLGFQPAIECAVQGFVSTAAIASITTSTGTTVPLVYVAAPDGYLYAMNASDGSVRWQLPIVIPSTTQNDAFNWSSPTIIGNNLYVGFSSNCDNPFIRGGLAMFDRTTGARLATYYSVPAGSTGGGVWTSAAGNGGGIYVTTGSPNAGTTGDVNAFVKLNPTTLARVSGWVLPLSAQAAGDPDWGSSPTLFKAIVNGNSVSLVGACNKDGIYYAFKTSSFAAPYWQFNVGVAMAVGCSSGATRRRSTGSTTRADSGGSIRRRAGRSGSSGFPPTSSGRLRKTPPASSPSRRTTTSRPAFRTRPISWTRPRARSSAPSTTTTRRNSRSPSSPTST